MFDLKSYSQVSKGSNKSFGIIFSIIFTLLFFYIYLTYNIIIFELLIIGTIFFLISLFFSKFLEYPNFLWFKFGLIIGNIISPIIMCLIYFSLFVPFGLFLKILRIDLLNLKYKKDIKTYWKDNKHFKSNMKDQF